MVRLNQNLTKTEAAIERSIAASHGYTASSGPHAGEGSSLQFRLAIIAGELATVLLDSDERWHAIRLLEAHEDETLQDIGHQLRRAAEREQRREAEEAAEYIDIPRPK